MLKHNTAVLAFVVVLMTFFIACTPSTVEPTPVTTPPPPPVSETPPPTEVTLSVPGIGDMAPQFTLSDLHEKQYKLSDYRGKPVMLFFWVIDCKVCQEELHLIQAYYEKNAVGGIPIITISVGEPLKRISEFIQQNKYTFPVLIDEKAEVCLNYGRGAPTLYILDSNGRILFYRDEAFKDVQELEETILKYTK